MPVVVPLGMPFLFQIWRLGFCEVAIAWTFEMRAAIEMRTTFSRRSTRRSSGMTSPPLCHHTTGTMFEMTLIRWGSWQRPGLIWVLSWHAAYLQDELGRSSSPLRLTRLLVPHLGIRRLSSLIWLRCRELWRQWNGSRVHVWGRLRLSWWNLKAKMSC